MRLKTRKLSGTTDASGDLTVNDTISILGLLYKIEWNVGDFAAGVDATFTVQTTESGDAETLLTLTNANADASYYPRVLLHDATGTALTGTAGGDRDLAAINGTLRMVVAQGGNAKTGTAIVYYIPGR